VIVIGSPLHTLIDSRPRASGLAVAIARAAKTAGADVEIVGRVGEDPAGDAVLLDLAAAGIGHVAVLRDAGRPTGAAPATPEPERPFGDRDLDPSDPSDAALEPPAAQSIPAEPLSLDAADIELALRYIPDYRVVVIAQPLAEDALEAAAAAARWGSAALVVLVPAGSPPPEAVTPDVTILETPPADPDDVFATLVGGYAAALDRGEDAGEAFATVASGRGWTAAAD
jgi:sugar/nucleoside kinase (ribokinase family)